MRSLTFGQWRICHSSLPEGLAFKMSLCSTENVAKLKILFMCYEDMKILNKKFDLINKDKEKP